MRHQWEQCVRCRLETRLSLRDWWPWTMKSIHCEYRLWRDMQSAQPLHRLRKPLPQGNLAGICTFLDCLKAILLLPAQLQSMNQPGNTTVSMGVYEEGLALVYRFMRRKWKLISHPDTTNPFVASFVNYRCTCRLYPITVGSQTFFDWKGKPF